MFQIGVNQGSSAGCTAYRANSAIHTGVSSMGGVGHGILSSVNHDYNGDTYTTQFGGDIITTLPTYWLRLGGGQGPLFNRGNGMGGRFIFFNVRTRTN